MEQLNYPMKYALLPVKSRRKNKNGEEFIINECYIVSKVYVMEEHIIFLEDGNYGGNYKVCYPYLVYSDGIDLEKKTPIDYRKMDHEETIFYLYDTFEDATAAKEKVNVLIPTDVVEKYKPFEDRLLELTSDMLVEKDNKVKIKKKI